MTAPDPMTASAEVLQTIFPDLGLFSAEDIVAWREQHGAFPNEATLVGTIGLDRELAMKILELASGEGSAATAVDAAPQDEAVEDDESVAQAARVLDLWSQAAEAEAHEPTEHESALASHDTPEASALEASAAGESSAVSEASASSEASESSSEVSASSDAGEASASSEAGESSSEASASSDAGEPSSDLSPAKEPADEPSEPVEAAASNDVSSDASMDSAVSPAEAVESSGTHEIEASSSASSESVEASSGASSESVESSSSASSIQESAPPNAPAIDDSPPAPPAPKPAVPADLTNKVVASPPEKLVEEEVALLEAQVPPSPPPLPPAAPPKEPDVAPHSGPAATESSADDVGGASASAAVSQPRVEVDSKSEASEEPQPAHVASLPPLPAGIPTKRSLTYPLLFALIIAANVGLAVGLVQTRRADQRAVAPLAPLSAEVKTIHSAEVTLEKQVAETKAVLAETKARVDKHDTQIASATQAVTKVAEDQRAAEKANEKEHAAFSQRLANIERHSDGTYSLAEVVKIIDAVQEPSSRPAHHAPNPASHAPKAPKHH